MDVKKKRLTPKILALTLSIALVLGIFSSIIISDVFAANLGDIFVVSGINYEVTKVDEPAEVKVVVGSPEYTGIITIPQTVIDNEINYNITGVDTDAFDSSAGITHVNTDNSTTATALPIALTGYHRVDFNFKSITPNIGTPIVQFVNGDIAISAITPSSATHMFDGWYTETELTTPWVPSTTVTGNMTLFAKWTPKTFNITYNLDGGTEGTASPTTYIYGMGTALVAPTKDNYTFTGWYDAETGGSSVTEITTTAFGDKTLYARWQLADAVAPSFTLDLSGTDTYIQNGVATQLSVTATTTDGGLISYKWYSNLSNNNTSGTIISGETNATFTPPTTLAGTVYYYVVATNTKDGKTATTASAVKAVVVNAPATVTPTITYNGVEGATNPNPATYTQGTALTIVNPTKTNYTFDGWYDNAGFSGASISSISATETGAKTLWAKWKLINATAPTFTLNLSATGIIYTKDATATALTVTATGSGTLSYQWYSNDTNNTDTPITVGTSTNVYTPLTTAVGTAYYYVVVTNTDVNATNPTATATSSIAKVTVNATATTNAVVPKFTANLATTEVSYTKDATAIALNGIATATDGGTITYKWYSNTANSATGGTLIASATSATYIPATATIGTTYYYVITTNTKADATGNKTATATSNIAKITVKTTTTTTPTTPVTPITVLPAVVGSDAPKTILQGDNDKITGAVLSAEEKTKLASGSKISVNLKVEKITPPKADENAINLAINGKKIGLYLDLTLIKTIDGTASNVTATNTPIRITIDVPESLRKTGRVFIIMRSHNGVVTTLVDVDTSADTITFETDKFSTYALAYADGTTVTQTTNPQTNDNFPIIPAVMAVIVGLAVVLFMGKRRAKYKKCFKYR